MTACGAGARAAGARGDCGAGGRGGGVSEACVPAIGAVRSVYDGRRGCEARLACGCCALTRLCCRGCKQAAVRHEVGFECCGLPNSRARRDLQFAGANAAAHSPLHMTLVPALDFVNVIRNCSPSRYWRVPLLDHPCFCKAQLRQGPSACTLARTVQCCTDGLGGVGS